MWICEHLCQRCTGWKRHAKCSSILHCLDEYAAESRLAIKRTGNRSGRNAMTGRQQVAGRAHSSSIPCTPKMTLTASRRRSASPCAVAAAAASLACVLKSTLRGQHASEVSAVLSLTLSPNPNPIIGSMRHGTCQLHNRGCSPVTGTHMKAATKRYGGKVQKACHAV